MKTLGGISFVRNGIEFDYCYKESILSLLEFCDEVSVVDVGSVDGTSEILRELCLSHSKLKVYRFDEDVWNNVRGKTKLAKFQNVAVCFLDSDYQFLLQSDEVLVEKSYNAIREAMQTDAEAFFCKRINLWASPYKQLNVPQNRKPCSTEVIRLTKRGYMSYDDGENIAVPSASFDYVNEIRIYHMGFVRRRSIMKAKIINMQIGVFEMGNYDHKLDVADEFDPAQWFSETDLEPIAEPLPLLIQEWAAERAKDYE